MHPVASTLPGAGGGPFALSVGSNKITLPATDEAIVVVLGQPLRRD